VLLDLMLPGMDGLAVCRELRKLGDVPILIFTARDTGSKPGHRPGSRRRRLCDQPVDPIVLLARVRALLRRAASRAAANGGPRDIQLGGLRISESAREVWLHDQLIELTNAGIRAADFCWRGGWTTRQSRRGIPPDARHRLQRP